MIFSLFLIFEGLRRPGSVSRNALDSGSRGCGFHPCRGRSLDFVVLGSNPGRGSPSLSSLLGRYSGYHDFLVGRRNLQEWRPCCIAAMKQSNLKTLFCAQKPKCRLHGTFYLLPNLESNYLLYSTNQGVYTFQFITCRLVTVINKYDMNN